MTNSKIIELYGHYTKDDSLPWKEIITLQEDRYTKKKSHKIRKSDPTQTIGTTVVQYGRENKNIIIDPTRFYEDGKVFLDALHLLEKHEPGNEIHVIPEVQIPGGNVDFIMASVKENIVVDFVGIELQALDTTGSVWGERQLFLAEKGMIAPDDVISTKYGMNWKMTAKTILIQLHHKIITFEHVNKHLVLVAQDYLFEYMDKNFDFNMFNDAKAADSLHFHSYKYNVDDANKKTSIQLTNRTSSDSIGMANALGLKNEAKVELDQIIRILQSKISSNTLFKPISI